MVNDSTATGMANRILALTRTVKTLEKSNSTLQATADQLLDLAGNYQVMVDSLLGEIAELKGGEPDYREKDVAIMEEQMDKLRDNLLEDLRGTPRE